MCIPFFEYLREKLWSVVYIFITFSDDYDDDRSKKSFFIVFFAFALLRWLFKSKNYREELDFEKISK